MPIDTPSSSCLDFAVVVVESDISCPAAKIWSIIGDYQMAGQFLNVPVKKVGSRSGIGELRQIGSEILEVMVGVSQYRYTYAQIQGPMAQYAYHGCVSLAATGENESKLTYTLLFDQTSMAADRRAQETERLSARFGGMVQAMKSAVLST